MSKQMNRRQFLSTMGGLAAAPFIPGLLRQQRRPNVLFMLMDDMTYRAIESLNNPEVHTPNLNRLCQRGTSFTHAFNQGGWSAAVCVPARSMLVSGLNVWHAHKAHNEYKNIPLWGETFAQHGYETFFAGKWHLGEPSAIRSAQHIGPHSKDFGRGMLLSSGNQYFRPHDPAKKDILPEMPYVVNNLKESWKKHPNRPWNSDDQSLSGHWLKSNKNLDREWAAKHCPDARHSSDIWTQAAIEFLNNPPGGGKKPWFMHLAYFSPHDPRQSPKDFLNRYNADQLEVPPNFMSEFPFDQGDHRIRDEVLAPFPRSSADVQFHRREYYALITYIDHHIGRIMDTLDQNGMSDETIIIFTSDHGLAVGQHGLMGKQNLFDHSTRVPLIMAGPGIPAGHKVDHMVYHGGLFPTTCDLVDLPIPKTVEKESFADLASGQSRNGAQKPIYGAYINYQRSVRTKQHKLIEYRVNGEKHTQLFDLQENPLEINAQNLADESSYAGLIKDLRKQLHSLQKQFDDPMDAV